MAEYGDLRKRRVTAYLDAEEDRKALSDLAHQRGVSMSKLAAELLAAAIKRETAKGAA